MSLFLCIFLVITMFLACWKGVLELPWAVGTRDLLLEDIKKPSLLSLTRHGLPKADSKGGTCKDRAAQSPAIRVLTH